MTKWFVLFGRLEGISFLVLLFVAMPLKYAMGNPAMVKMMGPIHGGLFLVYCSLVFLMASANQWSLKQHLLAYLAAVVPFGPFIFERKFKNLERVSLSA